MNENKILHVKSLSDMVADLNRSFKSYQRKYYAWSNKDFEAIIKEIDKIESRVPSKIMNLGLHEYNLKPFSKWIKKINGLTRLNAMILFSVVDTRSSLSQWWKYTGQTTTMIRLTKKKQSYSKKLKALCFQLADELIIKKSWYYENVYLPRKEYETKLNDNAEYREQAFDIIKKIGGVNFARKNPDSCLLEGRLTKGHIDNRCRRYMMKIFLSHIYEMKDKWYLKDFTRSSEKSGYIEIPYINEIVS